MSLYESITNIVVGFGIQCAAQYALFLRYGIVLSGGATLTLGVVMTGLSLCRSFTIRRIFEEIRFRQAARAADEYVGEQIYFKVDPVTGQGLIEIHENGIPRWRK